MSVLSYKCKGCGGELNAKSEILQGFADAKPHSRLKTGVFSELVTESDCMGMLKHI
ncbi:MAG: hypothetical protein WC900_01760 [Oscillospiraceae bacterium]|jgi:hypothetical protein